MTEFDRELQDDIAAGERWLEGFDTPAPACDSIEQVKEAVRLEQSRSQAAFGGLRWAAWHGVAASAAAILVAVGVGWRSTPTPVAPAHEAVADSLPVWPEETEQAVLTLASLDAALSDLEAGSGEEVWNLAGPALYEALEADPEDASNEDAGDAGTSMRLTPKGIEELEPTGFPAPWA